jgi:hypothetical protein
MYVDPYVPAHALSGGAVRREPNGTGYGGQSETYPYAFYDDPFETLSAAGQLPSNPHSHIHDKIKEGRDKRRKKAKVEEKPVKEQTLLPKILSTLKTMFPTYLKHGDRESTVIQLLSVFLERGVLLESIATLLRNDDFEDITSNLELYTSVLEIIGKLLQHPELRSFILTPRRLYPMGLLETTFKESSILGTGSQIVTVS